MGTTNVYSISARNLVAFLDAFAKLLKATPKYVMSACPSLFSHAICVAF